VPNMAFVSFVAVRKMSSRRWRPASAAAPHTWLKLMVVQDVNNVPAATTLQVLPLGGGWSKTRTRVAAAVDATVEMM
jgi:hypothetical protein